MVKQAKPEKLIDYAKLRELGVPEEVIARMDPRDGGNITTDGTVVFLDEERLARKEHPEKPLHENHPNGLGIKNFLCQKVTCARPWNWELVLKEFLVIVAGAKLTGKDGMIPLTYKMITQFEPDDKMYTHGNMLPLNVDLSEEDAAKTTVLPIDLINDAIDKAAFIGKMDKCICRSAHHCDHYPAGHGCLFLNMAGVTAVKNGLARQITAEEAHEHVAKAQEYGLVGQALYVELEQLIWGFRNDKMDEFSEICFCCPCCCVAMGLAKNASREIKNRFAPSGFTAVIDHDKCIGCGKCLESCPMECMQMLPDTGKPCIDQEYCVGCGFCKKACPNGAIKIKQTMPMRESIHEYFLEEGRIDLVMDRCSMSLDD